jgi:hypothetical protein
LGFAGFLLSLFQPMVGMGRNPAVRQQGFQGRGVVRSYSGNPA